MIRTLTDLQDAMQGDFSWRKKELHGLKSLVSANQSTANSELYLRAAVTILYAHWEGFIKQIGGYYLEFVGRRKLPNNILPNCFLALSLEHFMAAAPSGNRTESNLQLVGFFRSRMTERSQIRFKAGVETKSNLGSIVFREIVAALGLDYSRFETKEKLIDLKLVENRNHIAHGQYLLIDFDEYVELHQEMIDIMQDFYNQVENAAVGGTYRLAKPSPAVVVPNP